LNPGIDPLGSAFDLDLVGPLPLSGRIEGLNGSLFLTAVLLIAMAGFFWLVKSHRACRASPANRTRLAFSENMFAWPASADPTSEIWEHARSATI